MALTPAHAGPASSYAAPVFDDDMTFAELGQTGLRQYSGYVREEFLPQLQGRQAARVFREMQDNDATIGGILFAITQTMRKIKWRVRPADTSPQALAEAQFADSLRFDMAHTWEDFIAEALSMLGYGFAAHEIVYKRRLGPQPGFDDLGERRSVPGSLFNDGRIGIRRLPIRGQDTVIKWFFGPNGAIQGLTQQPFTGGLVDIPVEKLLLFRPTAHKGNPEGRSILRTAYRAWYFVKRFQEEEAIFYERMSGVPIMFVPQELMDAAAAGDRHAQDQVRSYKRMVTNTKIGEQMGLLLPSNTWPATSGAAGSARMYDFKLETPQSRAGVDSDKVISRHRLDILMSVMADFLALGHASHGTQSLAENKIDMFFQAIEGWINAIAGVINRHLIPRVWELNAIDPALMPEFVPDLAQRIDIIALGDFVLKLAQSGMQMFPDTDLENYLRDAAGLPDLTDTAYATSPATSPGTLKTIDELAPTVAQRSATPGLVTRPSVEARGTGQVAAPTGPVVKAALEAAAAHFARQHQEGQQQDA